MKLTKRTNIKEYPMATLTHNGQIFIWNGTFDERELPKAARFRWNPEAKKWWTDDAAKAAVLAEYADGAAQAKLAVRTETLAASRATDANIEIPANPGCEYLPYQKAGIAYALRAFGYLKQEEGDAR